MNILTIDLEDWFHILDHDETLSPEKWERFESRVERNTDWLLEQLSLNKIYATFFCLGWIAKKYPALIKKIIAQGHEIASHSMNHQLVYLQSGKEFSDDLYSSLNLLGDLTGKKINTYRAPGFSVTEKEKLFFEILSANGIENDCSVFPARRNHGGYKSFPQNVPCTISINGIQLREFPMSVAFAGGVKFIYSGGGYFRVLPYYLIRSLMKNSSYVMTYFHPRDFDPEQPLLRSLPLRRRIMSYTGLRSSRKKFQKLLSGFSFCSVESAAGLINWKTAPIVRLD